MVEGEEEGAVDGPGPLPVVVVDLGATGAVLSGAGARVTSSGSFPSFVLPLKTSLPGQGPAVFLHLL